MSYLERDLSAADLRGILRYVPQWRGHIFVISVDASLHSHDNFNNLLLDIAVLRNLNIQVVLVYGIRTELARLAELNNTKITDPIEEIGPINDETLELAVQASGKISTQILQGLTQGGLNCAQCNAVRATEVGVINGQDQLNRGKVDKVETALLKTLLDQNILPIISPISFSRDGSALRLSADQLAAEVAISLKASKLIFLSSFKGLEISGKLQLNVLVHEIREILDQRPEFISLAVKNKTKYAVEAVEKGVPRAHLLDGRESETLLTEIFHKVGVGTMIYDNQYTQVRKAKRRDVNALANILKKGIKNNELRPRNTKELNNEFHHFYVYEIDGSIIGCVSLKPYRGSNTVELEAVSVLPYYQGQGIGKKLVEFALLQANKLKKEKIITLTTQSYGFFKDVCNFKDTDKESLPAERLKLLEESGRNSKILVKFM